MFRKKDTENELPASGEGAFRRPAGETAGKAATQPDLPRRKVDLPSGSAGTSPAAGTDTVTSAPQQPNRTAMAASG